MRKLLTVLAVAGVLMPSALQGQSQNGTVTATAVIEAVLQVTETANLDFGSLTPGSGVSLTPGNAPPASTTMGVLQIEHNSPVDVSVTLPTVLTGPGTDVPVTFSCGFSPASSGALDGGAPTACDALASRAAWGDGTTRTSFLQVGGTIGSGDTTNRIPGTYSASLVFTVAANY